MDMKISDASRAVPTRSRGQRVPESDSPSALSAGPNQEDIARAFGLPKALQLTLYLIGNFVIEHKQFPTSTQIAALKGDGMRVKDWSRGHMVTWFRELERLKLIAREGRWWKDSGCLTELGRRTFEALPETRPVMIRRKRRPGGIASDGGTRFKDMLFAADDPKMELIRLATPYSKIGHIVKKAKAGGRQMGLRIATFSLEEGRTCDPACPLAESLCYAGKMSRQQRILYEGLKTSRLVTKAICNAGQLHYRINTIGDFPSQEFAEGVVGALATTGSTAFGYTHWQPEHPLGEMLRKLSDWHWSFFAIRTSYEHGSREPLSERAAVSMEDFTPELLATHNAIACPEQTGQAKNCGECGLCWTTRRNIAFKHH